MTANSGHSFGLSRWFPPISKGWLDNPFQRDEHIQNHHQWSLKLTWSHTDASYCRAEPYGIGFIFFSNDHPPKKRIIYWFVWNRRHKLHFPIKLLCHRYTPFSDTALRWFRILKMTSHGLTHTRIKLLPKNRLPQDPLSDTIFNHVHHPIFHVWIADPHIPMFEGWTLAFLVKTNN